MIRPTRTNLFERRRELADFALPGWPQAAITRHGEILRAYPTRDAPSPQNRAPPRFPQIKNDGRVTEQLLAE